MAWMESAIDALWRGSLVVVPLAVLVGLICRWTTCRAGTRHAMWMVVLLFPLYAVLLPAPRIDVPASVDVEEAAPEADESLAAVAAAPEPPCDAVPDSTVRREITQPDALWGAPLPAGLVILPEVHDSSGEIAESDVDAPASVLDEEPAGEPADRTNDIAVDETAYAHLDEPEPAARIADRAAGMPAERDDPERVIGAVDAGGGASWRDEWKAWAADLMSVRDALGALSPIPASLWLFGTLVMVAGHGVGIWRTCGRLRQAYRAPASVRVEVEHIARVMGLKHAPRCLMVKDRSSPMVWCLRRTVLVLPAHLWLELDAVGRRTVIVHELAHIRRRDHYSRWLDVAIGSIYWWHPLVWWVRSRVRAEAEMCCDAWVTWILPRSRRAYAEALLRTRRFVSENMVAAPALSMGAASRNKASFARRITMIMTRNDAPGLTRSAMAMAAAVLLAGWLATPASSCPPAEKKAKGCDEVTAPEPAGELMMIEPTEGDGAVYMVASSGGDADRDELEARIDKLEKKLQKIMEMLERQQKSAGLRQPTAPGAPPAPREFMVPSPAPKMKGEKLAKAYALPEGKLKALTALMVRNDVPVLVSPGKSEITVHGTPVEQAVFGWFVKLISDEETREFKLEPGKAEALIALMSRDDVPVLISPMEGGISVKGSPAQLDIFADFVNLISGKPITSTAALPADASKRLQAGIQAYQDMLKPFTDEQWQKQWQHQWKWAEKAYRDSGHEAAIKAQRQALEKQIEHMHRQIEELNRKVEQMKKQAQKLREKAEGLAGAARSSIEAKVEQTNVVIEAINETIDQLRDEADGLAEKLDSLADRSGERQERRVASGVAG